ncbi:hypothetical protein EMIHUDRAFT_208402 [Emiliania huxleyi CCMP1516]|uniref:Peptidase S9 prolyl oligopeptidase catalytic domain-containing protein n=2 Tax=Emiliania huxleyi TaxID=2903 RepID=A0A0D3JAH7_EMIH1|nr:hypothetical protein EMIHUDRAFT_208402 [Emiliania huxleyi CCMP1516]EOD20512.1 hypothetical protein EMIHUDRAFT_208402 [Emiliania huxleyi CCMP1516]|eukprot:XP_005772941.1 hypothetical protein EMIHUDRAFT_208402 [Emiliania huxleyi CCMP1516]
MSQLPRLLLLALLAPARGMLVLEKVKVLMDDIKAKFQVESLDFTGPNIDVVIPVGASDERFPYIAFAHGFGDDVGWDQHGGVEDYADFGPALASYGFVADDSAGGVGAWVASWF